MTTVIAYQVSYGFFFYWIPLGINLLNIMFHKSNTLETPAGHLFSASCIQPSQPNKLGLPVILIITVTRIILKNCRLCVLSHARNLKWRSAQATSEWVVLHTGQSLGLALGEAIRFQVSPQWKSQWNKKCWNEHHSETLPLHQSSILHGLATN